MSTYSYIGGFALKRLDCGICEELCEHPQTICLARNELISEDKAQRVADLFKILGDTTRVKIIQALSKRELCVCDIAAVIGMGQSAISHQLRMLRNTRLVQYRKDGTMAWYSLNDEHIASLLLQGIEHVEHEK
jgi:DNA-binding transcriptional ArsR family regulator